MYTFNIINYFFYCYDKFEQIYEFNILLYYLKKKMLSTLQIIQ